MGRIIQYIMYIMEHLKCSKPPTSYKLLKQKSHLRTNNLPRVSVTLVDLDSSLAHHPTPAKKTSVAQLECCNTHTRTTVVCGYGSIPINTIFRGMNIHLPAILMFTRGTRFWHTAMCPCCKTLTVIDCFYELYKHIQTHVYKGGKKTSRTTRTNRKQPQWRNTKALGPWNIQKKQVPGSCAPLTVK